MIGLATPVGCLWLEIHLFSEILAQICQNIAEVATFRLC